MIKQSFSKLVVVLSLLVTSVSHADLIDNGTWNGWTVFANEDLTGSFDFVDPGFGGQRFDSEYLLYKLEGNSLSIGLQTGFDVITGHQVYNGGNYWAGDLFLNFGGSDNFAVDFGFSNCGYSFLNNKAGCDALAKDEAGLYNVSLISKDIYSGFAATSFQMAAGAKDRSIFSTSGSQVVGGELSYFRTATFDISGLDLSMIDASWTMSCGNDLIHNHNHSHSFEIVDVPEPSMVLIMGMSLIGLVTLRRRKN